jgi:uncharacterized membrane protein
LETADRRASRLALAALFSVTGTAHLVVPKAFERIVPGWLPGSAAAWNRAATVAELACALLLADRRTSRAGGAAATATLAAVWVANLQAAADGGYDMLPGALGSRRAAWIRVPLQLPLLWWAWSLWRGDRPGGDASRGDQPVGAVTATQ